VLRRRSCRSYSGAAIEVQALSDLMYGALGVSELGQARCLPSAGGLYPLELYVVSVNVTGLEPGLFHYDARTHGLSHLACGDFRPELRKAVFIQDAVERAAAVLILSGVF